MARIVEVFDATGVKRTVRAVDAKEIVATGGSYEGKVEKVKPLPEVAEEVETEPDGKVEKVTSTTPNRCLAIKGDGEQCGNDANTGSDYCHIAAHQKQGE